MQGTELGNFAVIVRAYGDEPVRLIAIEKRGRTVLVARTVSGATVGFPSENVYSFEAQRYRDLRIAFETGDRDALLSLWREAGRAL